MINRHFAVALALIAVAALCVPAIATAQVDAAAVKENWHRMSPAEQKAALDALRSQAVNAGGRPTPRGGPGGGADLCADAEAIGGCNTTVSWDNSAAGTDGFGDPLCLAFDEDNITNDVWFCWTAPNAGDTITMETCGLTAVDTKIAVYGPFADCAAASAGCVDPTILACNDDTCALQSQVIFNTGSAGEAYLVRLGNFPGADPGSGELSIGCAIPVELQEFTID